MQTGGFQGSYWKRDTYLKRKCVKYWKRMGLALKNAKQEDKSTYLIDPHNLMQQFYSNVFFCDVCISLESSVQYLYVFLLITKASLSRVIIQHGINRI